MASGKTGKERNAHAARERTRLYQARLEYHRGQSARRRRDTIIAVGVGGLIVIAAIASQFVYYGAGPGAPSPVPTTTSVPTIAPTPPSGTDTPPVTPVPTDRQIDDGE